MRNLLGLAAIGAALLLLAAVVYFGRAGAGLSTAPPVRVPASKTLDIGAGAGNEVGDDFTVPSGCGRQELTYRGQPAARGGFVNFRVYDAAGNPGDFPVGPVDLDEETEGAALWTLEPGAYSIEVTANAAREWSYTLRCR